MPSVAFREHDIHLYLYALVHQLFVVNILPLDLKHVDPYPFIFLTMIVSVNDMLLSTIVLMKQNRMQACIDIRDKLGEVSRMPETEPSRVRAFM